MFVLLPIAVTGLMFGFLCTTLYYRYVSFQLLNKQTEVITPIQLPLPYSIYSIELFVGSECSLSIDVFLCVILLSAMVVHKTTQAAFGLFVFIFDMQQFEPINLDTLLHINPVFFALTHITNLYRLLNCTYKMLFMYLLAAVGPVCFGGKCVHELLG